MLGPLRVKKGKLDLKNAKSKKYSSKLSFLPY
jgi:hypothetical protein